jgi:EEF1A N-terminal glycine/lysine methyltransferase
MSDQSDPEDILSNSLETLYGYTPITHSSPGSHFTYKRVRPYVNRPDEPPLEITLSTPDTHAQNWSLHASSIWVSSLYIADHLEDLHLDTATPINDGHPLSVLELGAGAGLPGILIAKTYPHVHVTSSDYPDAALVRALRDNVLRNGAADRCRVVPHAWGADIADLIAGPRPPAFDVILAADTLWNPELHALFINTLRAALARSDRARVHLVAGLHTGRYTMQSFMCAVQQVGFQVVEATEREVHGSGVRPWSVEWMEEEDERERRRWVVWIVLKWNFGR